MCIFHFRAEDVLNKQKVLLYSHWVFFFMLKVVRKESKWLLKVFLKIIPVWSSFPSVPSLFRSFFILFLSLKSLSVPFWNLLTQSTSDYSNPTANLTLLCQRHARSVCACAWVWVCVWACVIVGVRTIRRVCTGCISKNLTLRILPVQKYFSKIDLKLKYNSF